MQIRAVMLYLEIVFLLLPSTLLWFINGSLYLATIPLQVLEFSMETLHRFVFYITYLVGAGFGFYACLTLLGGALGETGELERRKSLILFSAVFGVIGYSLLLIDEIAEMFPSKFMLFVKGGPIVLFLHLLWLNRYSIVSPNKRLQSDAAKPRT